MSKVNASFKTLTVISLFTKIFRFIFASDLICTTGTEIIITNAVLDLCNTVCLCHVCEIKPYILSNNHPLNPSLTVLEGMCMGHAQDLVYF